MRGRPWIALALFLALLALAAAGLYRLTAPRPSTFYQIAASLAPANAAAFFSLDRAALPLLPAGLSKALPPGASRLAAWWEEPPFDLASATLILGPADALDSSGKEGHWERVGGNWLVRRAAAEPSASLLEAEGFRETLARFSRRDLVVFVDLRKMTTSVPIPGARRLLLAGGAERRAWQFEWRLETQRPLPSYPIALETLDAVPDSVTRYGAADVRLLRALYPERAAAIARSLARREIKLEDQVPETLSGEMAFAQTLPSLPGAKTGGPVFLLFRVERRSRVEDLIDRAFPPPVRTALSRQVHDTTVIRSFGRLLAFAVTDRFLLVALKADGAALERHLEAAARRPLSHTAGFKLLKAQLGSARPLVVSRWTLESLTDRWPGLDGKTGVWQAAASDPGGLSGVLLLTPPGD